MTLVKFLYKPCTPPITTTTPKYWIKYDRCGASLGITETCTSTEQLHQLLKQLFRPELSINDTVDDLVIWECDANGDPNIWLYEYHYDFTTQLFELEMYALAEEFILSIRTDDGSYPRDGSELITNTPMIIK